MYLTFVDLHDVEGTIAPDWSIEYDGTAGDAIEAIVAECKNDLEATDKELQDLSVALFTECPLAEVRLVEDRTGED